MEYYSYFNTLAKEKESTKGANIYCCLLCTKYRVGLFIYVISFHFHSQGVRYVLIITKS